MLHPCGVLRTRVRRSHAARLPVPTCLCLLRPPPLRGTARAVCGLPAHLGAPRALAAALLDVVRAAAAGVRAAGLLRPRAVGAAAALPAAMYSHPALAATQCGRCNFIQLQYRRQAFNQMQTVQHSQVLAAPQLQLVAAAPPLLAPPMLAAPPSTSKSTSLVRSQRHWKGGSAGAQGTGGQLAQQRHRGTARRQHWRQRRRSRRASQVIQSNPLSNPIPTSRAHRTASSAAGPWASTPPPP